jgi:glycogen phosphorylase
MIATYETLKELALDLRWSWNHSADILWKELDPDLWALTRNPWVVLQTVSKKKLQKALSNPKFKRITAELLEAKKARRETPGWFQKVYPGALTSIAYFSMEFMLSEALPIYSGGLGNVAGDQLKAASDLGVPVVGIGLLYSKGYFRQIIDKYGHQQAIFPYNDPGQLPISPLRNANGEWLRLEIALPGWSVWVRAWEVQVGKVKLYLLDTNDAANFPVHRGITDELYVQEPELRLKQEIVLGIGGWKLIDALGTQPEVCHLNEGHAAFAILERTRSYMEKAKVPFDVALAATRPGNLFTTHTAVPSGFDRFPSALIRHYLGSYAESQLKVSFQDFMTLGREIPDVGYFNMAHLAIRGSGAINGVSKLHGFVSRRLFHLLFPRWPESDVPVGFVTNGVHMPSWDSLEADNLWTEFCGKSRWLESTEALEEKMRIVPDRKIWDMREKARERLVEFTRTRLAWQLEERGMERERIDSVKSLFDPKALTLGFARRFAAYKRPNLLLHDSQRLLSILTNPERPVQLILAGKAHPADRDGQKLIKDWMHFISQFEEARSRVVFLSDYDMGLTEQLVQGADLWINTPRRPWEACGTSGMKVLVNGGLNLSELDGWWAESYAPEVGWAIGDKLDRGDDPAWDAVEANALYDLLEQKIVPEFYQRNQDGIPVSWVAKIRESMARLTPLFSANRSVRQYSALYYIPAAQKMQKRTANQSALARKIIEWCAKIEENWAEVRFGSLNVYPESEAPQNFYPERAAKVARQGGNDEFEGEPTTSKTNFSMDIDQKKGKQTFEVEVFLGNLDPADVLVELFANGDPPLKQEMKITRNTENSYFYSAVVATSDAPDRFTPRISPFHPDVSIPLELAKIKWQK